MSKLFHIGDVLSITTGRLVSPTHMDGVYAILNYMTGDSLFTHQLPRASRECAPWLLRQHPQLDSDDIRRRVEDLVARLGLQSAEPNQVVRDWLAEVVAVYGAELPVDPIPADDHDRKNPLTELVDMVGAEKVVVVEPPRGE